MAHSRKVAGDRGLALVVIGLIGLSVFWRLDANRPRLRTANLNESSAAALSGWTDERGVGGSALSELTKRVAGDYKLFHHTLKSIAGMPDSAADRADAELSFSGPMPVDGDEVAPVAPFRAETLDNSIR